MKCSFLIILLAGFTAFAQNNEPVDDYSLDLFRDAAGTPQIDRSGDLAVRRSNFVEIRTQLFSDRESNMEGRREPGAVLILNLFPDVYYTAVLDRTEETAEGNLVWIGYLDDSDNSNVTLVVGKDGIVVGNVVLPGALYQIRYAGNGVHAVYDINSNAMPPDGEPLAALKEGEPTPGSPIVTETGVKVDVMVVYTAAARSAEGGTSAMNSLVALAVAEANQSYVNSGVNFSLRLRYRGEVSYTESSSFSTNLSRLADPSDGHMDDVHTLRDTHCADVVALIINQTAFCGIAYKMNTISSAFESSAFSVTARTCATGYYSFAHEIGHNMGADHDWHVSSNTTPYVYSHGQVNVPDNWRTIMAYDQECADSGTTCTRIQHWSNPSVNYSGDPTGVGGSTVNSSANNALTLNNTVATVAGFRNCPNQLPTVSISKPTDGSFLSNIDPINLRGSASDPEDGSMNSKIVWTSTNQGYLGTGSNLYVNLNTGVHVIEATVTDCDGGSRSTSVIVEVGAGCRPSGAQCDYNSDCCSNYCSGWFTKTCY